MWLKAIRSANYAGVLEVKNSIRTETTRVTPLTPPGLKPTASATQDGLGYLNLNE